MSSVNTVPSANNLVSVKAAY